MNKALAALAVVFLAAHLPFLPPTLEDIDSINFALGVREFDVARHQPHPPGYPVFVALGKISTFGLRTLGVSSPEPRGLAIWSTLAGALALLMVFALVRALAARGESLAAFDGRCIPARGVAPPLNTPGILARRALLAGRLARLSATPDFHHGLLDQAERRAWWTTLIVAACPLFWFTALRPLSDMTGLCAVLAAQALAAGVITGRGAPRTLMWAGLVAGLAIGIRSQTLLLTFPLIGLALVLPGLRLTARERLWTATAVVVGVVAWGVPLLVASGGPAAYLAALGSQAGEDFSGVVMLWTTRKARVALDALQYSFLWPWGWPIVGGFVSGAAALGSVRVAWRLPRTAFILLAAFGPYAMFHLVFQETATTRYALPLVVPIAYFAVSVMDAGGRIAMSAGAIALIAVCLATAVPATVAYGRDASPAFRALSEISGSTDRATDAVAIHAVMRRAAEWEGPALPGRILKAPHGREWITLVEDWRSHPDSSISFVTDPRRTDLALFDATARRLRGAFRWPFAESPFVGGARPGPADCDQMRPPGWMLDRGWSLTAEVAGIAARDGVGPHRRPSVAWIRTRTGDATMMIGGRHLGGAADPAVRIHLTRGDHPLESFEAKPGFFFRIVALPSGALAGANAYMPMAVTSEAADGSRREIAVALEQFDLQPAGVPMVGVEEGWQEPEYDRRTAQSWRWMTERATLWVRPIGRDVTLSLAGESPLRYYDTAPTVTVTVGGRQIARMTPSTDFAEDIVLPADALASAAGHVVVETDRWFVPGDRDGSLDRRHLALRIYSFSVK